MSTQRTNLQQLENEYQNFVYDTIFDLKTELDFFERILEEFKNVSAERLSRLDKLTGTSTGNKTVKERILLYTDMFLEQEQKHELKKL